MKERLKSLGNYGLGFALLIAVIVIPFLLLKGAVWASEHLLAWVMLSAWIALAIDLFVLLPLSILRRLRPHTGGLIFLSSYLFGSATWLYSFVITWTLWGGMAVIIGMMFFGVGVVFMAALASLFKAMWSVLFNVIVLVVITWVLRVVGHALGSTETTPRPRDINVVGATVE